MVRLLKMNKLGGSLGLFIHDIPKDYDYYTTCHIIPTV